MAVTQFHPIFFDSEVYDTGTPLIVAPVRRGIPINAYKQFKYIDRHGNAYYYKKDEHGYEG